MTGLTHKKNGKKLWTLKSVSWWDELELTKDRRFKKLDLGPDKLVYESIFTLKEFRKLHEKYKEKFLAVFEDDALEKPYRLERIRRVQELEDNLNDPKLRFVNVWLFDWDY